MTGPRPILIIQAERLSLSHPDLHARIGDMDSMICASLPQWRRRIVVCNVAEGEPLPAAEAIAGAIITGASAMVSDPAAWIGVLEAWIRSAVSSGLPLLGICFGHQLIAKALGGEIGPNPDGPEYATVEIDPAPSATEDALFANVPCFMDVQAAHFERVSRLPPDACALASGATGIHAARYAPSCWGVQFHPEFSPTAMFDIIEMVALQQPEETAKRLRACSLGLRPSPEAGLILQRFGAICLDRTLEMRG